MAFGDAAILDNFNRDDEGPPPSADWTDLVNGMKVVSSRVEGTTAGVNWSMWDTSTFGPDCEVYMTMAEKFSTTGVGVFTRGTTLVSGTIDGYLMHYNDTTDKLEVNRCDNGAFTLLGAQVDWTSEAGDKLGGESIGNTHKTYVNEGAWVEKVSRDDATYGSAGYIGIRPISDFDMDDFGGGTIAGGIAVFASISDGLGISDTIATKTGYIRSAVDSVGISDVLTRIATYIRSLASNLATTDTINTASNLKRSIADNVPITDTVITKKFVLVALSDNLGITDVVTRIITFVRSIPDALAISDTLTTIRTIVRSVADAVGITDVLTSEKFILVAIADGIGLTDVIATIGTFIRSVTDGVGITDVVTRIGTFIRSESDNVGVSDTVTASKGVSRTITDGVGITDVIAAVLGKLSSIADNLGITDVLTFIKTTVVGGRVFIASVVARFDANDLIYVAILVSTSEIPTLSTALLIYPVFVTIISLIPRPSEMFAKTAIPPVTLNRLTLFC